MEIRQAERTDALDLAYLINLAGEGIPEYLWQYTQEAGETPLSAGARRVSRDKGFFSYKNCLICHDGSQTLGMAFAYQLPDPYRIDPDQFSAVIYPLIELEALVGGSWYINSVATFEQYRGMGVATMLLQEAEKLGQEKGCNIASQIVASENVVAHSIYGRLGYREVSSKPVTAYPGCLHGGRWLLMVKPLHSQPQRTVTAA